MPFFSHGNYYGTAGNTQWANRSQFAPHGAGSAGATVRRVLSGRVGTTAGVLAVVVLLAGLTTTGWVVTETGVAPDKVPSHAEAVVALVGDPGRLAPAEALARRTDATLVISQRTRDSRYYDAGDRPERCATAEGDDVVCFVPDPYATRGEARAVGELATARGWDHLAVVTSRYHLRRAGLLVRQCLPEAEVRLVAADDELGPHKVLREAVALGPAVTIHRAC